MDIFAPAPALPMRVFQIWIGAICLIWFMLLGQSGIGSPELASLLSPNNFGGDLFKLAVAAGIAPNALIKTMIFAGWTAALGLVWGWHPRFMAAVLFFALAIIQYRTFFIMFGGDILLKLFVVYIFIAPSPRLGPTKLEWKIPGPGLRLVQLQMALIYLSAALWKAVEIEWWTGESMYKALHMASYSRFANWLPNDAPLFYQIFGIGAVLLEFSTGVLLLSKSSRYRIAGVILGFSLHMGLEIFLAIPFWQWVMLGGLIACIPQEYLLRGLRVVRPSAVGVQVPQELPRRPRLAFRVAVYVWIFLALITSPGIPKNTVTAALKWPAFYFQFFQNWNMYGSVRSQFMAVQAEVTLKNGKLIHWRSPRGSEVSYAESYRLGRINRWIESIVQNPRHQTVFWKSTADFIAAEVGRQENEVVTEVRLQTDVFRIPAHFRANTTTERNYKFVIPEMNE